jgi:outer membrane PBP1 activator LpoA protein
MNIRFHTFTLSIVLLMMLNACGTTGPAPVVEPVVEQDLPAPIDIGEDMLRDPSYRSLVEIEELANGMIGYQPDVVLEVLRSLEYVPSGQLVVMIDSQIYTPEFTEWLELSLQVRSLLINGRPVKYEARKWADYHYGHAITQDNFPDLVARYGAMFPVPSQVAILLPAEGGLGAVAKAIRDGILSAYLEQPGDAVIRFYSSGENGESAIAAYLQAREDGATQVIGPLRVESTRALANLDDLGLPLLLLNQFSSEEPLDPEQTAPGHKTSINSLLLSQTEEAAAIAHRALAQGQNRALVIVPDSAWGLRIETTFATVFEQGDGHISAITHFNTAANDHSAMLTQTLKIDESKQRKTDLQSWLGIPLTFEPNRRDDFDFIFMAANPVEGRELKPLLRFHDAGDIPVYAMGRIFSGRIAPASDLDLNGIVFPSTRWQLNSPDETTLALESVRGGALGNFYALGQDAWRLLPWLPLMQKDPDLWFPGDVGVLRLQADGHLYRQPAWAQFSAGRPVPYQWPDNL